jgi:peptidoglycan/LPS O-acetylase OafA/YrhL
MKKPNALTNFLGGLPNPEPHISGHEYLNGLRGLLVIESFLWVFLLTFQPTAVKGSSNVSGPAYQSLLRETLSVLLWNEPLLYSSAILLSARTVCIPFLTKPTTTSVASAAFRRSISLLFPLIITLGITTLTYQNTGVSYINDFKNATQNHSFDTPFVIPNALAFFNSIFNLFWITKDFSSQAGNLAFPTQTLWLINVIYSQSYTVYMTMLIIPYTRPRWRVHAAILFIITAWWVQSWAWYSITGLLLADVVINMDFRQISQRGITVYRSIRLPSWTLYIGLMAAGLVMQYLWTAWRPEYENYELKVHTGLYYTGGLNTGYDVRQPQARDDNYVVLLGFFLLLETSEFVQHIFQNPLFMYLGRRSYSYFLTQSFIVQTVGIKLFLHLTSDANAHALSFPAAVGTAFCTCLAAIVLVAEGMYWLVDRPARAGAKVFFEWMRR